MGDRAIVDTVDRVTRLLSLSRLRGRGYEDLAACCLVAVGEGLSVFLRAYQADSKTLPQPPPVKTGEG
jgi:hypothetical protein